MRLKIAASLALAALPTLMGGCAGPDAPQSQTPTEQAIHNWNSTRAAVLFSLARDQYANGNFDKCRDTLTQATRMDPENPAIRILSAKLAIEQGQLELADQELVIAAKLFAKTDGSVATGDGMPSPAEADFLSGVVYQRWQQPAKALAFYQSACEKDPGELSYVMAKAEMLVSLNRQSEALILLQSKVVYFEHSAAIRDAVGMLLIQQHQLDPAIEMFRRASILSPDDVTIREHLAMALFQGRQYIECSDLLTELVKDPSLDKRADLRLTLAECQLEMGRPTMARASAQIACDLDSSLASAWLMLAKASFQMGDHYQTQVALNKTFALDPNSSEAYLLQGYLRLKQSKYPEAIDAFTNAANYDKTDSTALCMIGYVYEKTHRPQDAAHYYNLALKMNPKDELARKLMADAGVE